MRCQDVERLILETRELDGRERAAVEAHQAQCSKCASFGAFWQGLHAGFGKAPAAKLPADLAERVRLAAHAKILVRPGGRAARARKETRPAVPGFIWAAFAAITVLTLGFLIPGVQDFVENQKLTLGTALVLILLLQNTLTLLLAPVVLRRPRQL
jgi:anti-sigma factor RsiW